MERETVSVRRRMEEDCQVRQQKEEMEEETDKLLGTTVKQTNVGISPLDPLSPHLQNETEHTVGSRMLGSKVDRVVLDLANGFLHVRLV